MKRTKILYWVFTALIAAFMLFSAIPNIISNADSIALINGVLGYPKYIIPFLGLAKAIAAIAILIPGLKRIKEWAYAGLCFDLVGATYSLVAVGGVNVQIIFMILPIVVLFISYYFWVKVSSPA